MNYDFIQRYLGLPWVNPKDVEPSLQTGFDCHSATARIFNNHAGTTTKATSLPAIDANDSNATARQFNEKSMYSHFTKTSQDALQDFDILVMKAGGYRHVGIYLNGRVLHFMQVIGCLYTPVGDLKDLQLTILSVWRHDELCN